MHWFASLLSVLVFFLFFSFNGLAANPKHPKDIEASVPVFLALLCALGYDLAFCLSLYAFSIGGISHPWLVCLPFGMIVATGVYLFFAKKRTIPILQKAGRRTFPLGRV
jgi:hypothetical protein